MKETRMGILASVTLHAFVISLAAALSIGAQSTYRPIKTVVLDFTVLKDHVGPVGDGHGSPGQKERRKEGHGPTRLDTTPEKPVAVSRKQNVPRITEILDAAKTSSGKGNMETTVFDPEGVPVILSNTTNPAHRGGGSGIESVLSGGSGTGMRNAGSGHDGSGGGGGGSGSGSGGAGGDGISGRRDYLYIRDTVLKNIKYPEKARRMGIEGKVLLSFVVLESGTTSEVKVVRSSGSCILDENAKETVERTKIARKTSYRAAVSLPITYKLH